MNTKYMMGIDPISEDFKSNGSLPDPLISCRDEAEGFTSVTKETLRKAFEAAKPKLKDTGRVLILTSAHGGMAHQNFKDLMKEAVKSYVDRNGGMGNFIDEGLMKDLLEYRRPSEQEKLRSVIKKSKHLKF